MVGLSVDASNFIQNLQRYFDLLHNITCLNLAYLPEQSVDNLIFMVGASQFNCFAYLASSTKLKNVCLWIVGMIEGMLTLRAYDDDY